MAVLDDNARAALWRKVMRIISERGVSTNLLKSRWRAAVDATDNWIEANAASFNNALPEDVRAALTTREKLYLFKLVADERYMREGGA